MAPTRWSRRRAGRGRGFTLVEALVSVAVFALGIAALMPLVTANVRANDAAGVRTEALAVCQSKIEAFRDLTYDEVIHYSPQSGSETVDEEGNPDPHGVFTREWEIVPGPGPAPDSEDLRRITVQVRWSLPGRPAGRVELVAARTRY